MMRVLLLAAALAAALPAAAQEGVFLSESEAPAAVFHEADRFERMDVPATPALRVAMRERLSAAPSLWEDHYVVFRAWKGGELLGLALLVDEIGKHRPISFVVGLRPNGSVEDVAVMAYREPYGGEVRSERFLVQFRDRRAADSLRPHRDITNIAGATLSVEAASRAVKKAQALAAAMAAQTP